MTIRQKPEIHGVCVIDKPRGPTSHDVVSKVRRALGTREVGHAGTLDPMATGVLVVLVGEGTKLAPYLTAEDKTYLATMKLGVATSTLDAEGEIVERKPAAAIDDETLQRALQIERARREQIPPLVSAIKIGGVAAHKMARRGESVDLAPRSIEVRSIEVIDVRGDEIDLALTVSKGYYVRALARDLAASLGTVAHLTALRRTKSGAFTVDEATSLDAPALVPIETAAARTLPIVHLTSLGTTKARQGKTLQNDDALDPIPDTPSAWLDDRGALVAIGRRDEGVARVLRGFREIS